MRRIITIIITLILLIGIILLIAWLRSRQTAIQEGRDPLSFRSFIGIKNDQQNPADPSNPDFSSDFTPPDETPSENPGETPESPLVAVSQFTSGPLSPAQDDPRQNQTGSNNNNQNTSSPGGGSSTGTSSGGSTGNPQPPVTPPNPVIPTTTAPACSDEDLNITFTSEELARLSALQNQFDNLAELLHTDEDIAIELANYDNFKAKADEAIELYNYCVSRAPLLTTAPLKSRTATPFWRDPVRDEAGYMPSTSRPGSFIGMSLFELIKQDGPVDPRREQYTHGVMQRIFKLHLW